MKRIARSVVVVGALMMGGLPVVGISPVRAQDSASPPGPYYIPAPTYSVPAPAYSAPAPAYSAPAWGVAAPAPAGSPPGGNYSYYDADGVEHDSRYPHWSYDSNWYLHG